MSQHKTEEQLRKDIVANARALMGTKFRHRGRELSQGLDCVGFVKTAIEEAFGNPINVTEEYSKRPTTEFVMKQIYKYADRIPIAQAKPGDVVIMSYADETTHFGILSERNTIIHCTRIKRKVVEDSLRSDAGSRVMICFRYKGFAHG